MYLRKVSCIFEQTLNLLLTQDSLLGVEDNNDNKSTINKYCFNIILWITHEPRNN